MNELLWLHYHYATEKCTQILFVFLFQNIWVEKNGVRQRMSGRDQLISCGYTTTYQVLPVSQLE